jgi:hypothetical protein
VYIKRREKTVGRTHRQVGWLVGERERKKGWKIVELE